MLKITYTDSGLFLECLSQPLEALVAQRCVLSIRSGQSQFLQSAYAAVPLQADLPGIENLRRSCAAHPTLALDWCDHHLLELTVQGTWLATSPGSDEGVFVTELDVGLETHILELWAQSQQAAKAELGRQLPRAC